MVMNRDWVTDSVVAKVIVNSIIGVLWEGVTHEDSQVRILTVRSLTCATKLLTIEEISTQLFPPINSLVNDENSLVRSETAKTIAILQQRLQTAKWPLPRCKGKSGRKLTHGFKKTRRLKPQL